MTAAPGPQQPNEVRPADCVHCCPSGWSPNIDQVPDEDCPVHGRPAAPSAQPDEPWSTTYARGLVRGLAAGLDLDAPLLSQRGPAQPVRDTEEGRR